MSLVVNVTPNLKYRPVWIEGVIDFEVEMTHRHLVQTTTGMRGGAAKQFGWEWQWAVGEFIKAYERKGCVFLGLPSDMPPIKDWVNWKGTVLARGPILGFDYESPLPRAGDDNEEISRRTPLSLNDTGGKVVYEMRSVFAVKEHVLSQVIERNKAPEHFDAIRNAKKENGLWKPVAVPKKQHFLMGANA